MNTSCCLSVCLCPRLQSGHSEAPTSQSSCHQQGHTRVRCFHVCRACGVGSPAARGGHRAAGIGGRHRAPRGEGLPPNTRSPGERFAVEQGSAPGWRNLPGLLPLETPLPGSSASAGSDYPHGLQSVLWWRPLPSAEPALPADVTPLPATCQAGLRARRPPPPHPARSPACHGLSSSARLVTGTSRPGPPPWHCQSSFQHLETHPPCPL